MSAKFRFVDMFLPEHFVEMVCCLYRQKEDFISVPYEPKNADYLKKMKVMNKSSFAEKNKWIIESRI